MVSKLSQGDDDASDMKEGSKHLGMPLVTHDEASEVLRPGDRAFDFPAPFVAPQSSAILRFHFLVRAIGADQLDPASLEPLPQRVAVGGPIVDETLGILARPTPPDSRGSDVLQ